MSLMSRYAWVLGVLGALLFVAFGSVWFVTRELGSLAGSLGIASGVLLMAYAFLDGDRLAAGSSTRAFRYGSGAVVLTGLAGVAAATLYVLADRHDTRWDLTSDGRFTLSEHTKSVLGGLERDVEVFAFFRHESPEERRFQDLIDGYDDHTQRLRVEIVDPLRSPIVAQQFAITSENGAVVLRSGEDRQRLEADFSEEALTQAIVRLMSGVSHRVCWSVGHGEADPDDDYEPTGYGAAVIKLEGDNYQVTEQRVLTEGVDRACEALVIAAPQTDWLPREREALAAYLAEGGRALVMLEPDAAPQLAADLARYGVEVGDDVVLEGDVSRRVAEQDPSFIAFYGDGFGLHPVTRALGAVVMLSVARSVVPAEDAAAGLIVQPLLKTSPDAWGELSFRDPTAALGPDPGIDRVGPFAVAVAVEITDPAAVEVARPRPASPLMDAPAAGSVDDESAGVPGDFTPEAGGRLVVIGDADFATNQLVALGNDQDLFLNAIAWLTDEDDQLGERPNEDASEALALTLFDELALWLISVFLVPGGAVAAAAVVMIRRRSL